MHVSDEGMYVRYKTKKKNLVWIARGGHDDDDDGMLRQAEVRARKKSGTSF